MGVLIAVFFGFVLVGSLVGLYRQLFVLPNPLSRNTEGRIEAAQNPQALMDAWRDYQRRRVVGNLLWLTVVFGILVFFAPQGLAVMLDGMELALREIGQMLLVLGNRVVEYLGTFF